MTTSASERTIMAMAHDLAALLERVATKSLRDAPNFKEMIAHCRQVSPAWPARFDVAGANCRRLPLFCGPLFTTVDYPWPSSEGHWLEPIVQLDLAQLGGLREIDLGSGLLQLWLQPGDALLRVIPAFTVATAEPTPAPCGSADHFHKVLVDWSDGEPEWSRGLTIVGFDDPFIDYGHNQLQALLDWLLEDVPDVDPRIREQAERLHDAVTDSDWYNLCHRAFGMTNESEFDAYDAPNVIFVIEPDPPRIADSSIGNDGIYLCYHRDAEGRIEFSARGRGL